MSAASSLRSLGSHTTPFDVQSRPDSIAHPITAPNRPMLGFVVGTLLGTACWAAIAFTILHEPTRRLLVASWPAAVVVAAALAARLLIVTRRRRARPGIATPRLADVIELRSWRDAAIRAANTPGVLSPTAPAATGDGDARAGMTIEQHGPIADVIGNDADDRA